MRPTETDWEEEYDHALKAVKQLEAERDRLARILREGFYVVFQEPDMEGRAPGDWAHRRAKFLAKAEAALSPSDTEQP